MSVATDKKTRNKRENLRPFKTGDPPGPGRPPGTGYKQRALKAFMGMLSGSEGEKFLKVYLGKFRKAAHRSDSWQSRFIAERLFKDDVLDQIDEWMDRGERRERAFLSYQLHKVATDIQRQILFTRAPYLMAMAGRRGGKSEGLKLWFADRFVQKSNARCLYIGLTITKAMSLLWQPMVDAFGMLGIKVVEHQRIDGRMVLEGGGVMQFGGNTTKDEREKNRGPYWDRIAIDECQSQKELRYLVETILSPTLIDTKGQIAFAGTGPRVRGEYWEALFLGVNADNSPLYPDAFRVNFNISDNPFIEDYQTRLAEIRKDKNLKETDSLYIREYLGRIAYDDDALVLRLTEANAFEDKEFEAWIASQPVTDVRFSGGLDFGFETADALAIKCYSVSKPERFTVYEWKANRTGTAQIAEKCKEAIAYVNTSPLFAKVTNKHFYIHADTGGNAITPFDLATQYNLPIQAAYKQEKEMAIELLQDECRRGIQKFRRGGPLWDESLKTVYARNEQDQLTREIDDETYHPDSIFAELYGMRPIWLFNTGGGK
jgi:hypothetical protein